MMMMMIMVMMFPSSRLSCCSSLALPAARGGCPEVGCPVGTRGSREGPDGPHDQRSASVHRDLRVSGGGAPGVWGAEDGGRPRGNHLEPAAIRRVLSQGDARARRGDAVSQRVRNTPMSSAMAGKMVTIVMMLLLLLLMTMTMMMIMMTTMMMVMVMMMMMMMMMTMMMVMMVMVMMMTTTMTMTTRMMMRIMVMMMRMRRRQ